MQEWDFQPSQRRPPEIPPIEEVVEDVVPPQETREDCVVAKSAAEHPPRSGVGEVGGGIRVEVCGPVDVVPLVHERQGLVAERPHGSAHVLDADDRHRAIDEPGSLSCHPPATSIRPVQQRGHDEKGQGEGRSDPSCELPRRPGGEREGAGHGAHYAAPVLESAAAGSIERSIGVGSERSRNVLTHHSRLRSDQISSRWLILPLVCSSSTDVM